MTDAETPKKPIPKEYKEALALCSELVTLTPSVTEIVHDGGWSILLLNSFAKAQKTFRAVLMLCKSGYGEDALILARTLLEQAFTVKFISLNVDSRLPEFVDYSVAIKEKYLERKLASKKDLLPDFDVEALKLHLEKEKEETRSQGRDPDRFRLKNGEIANSWTGTSIGNMAKKTGLGHYYDVYWLACNLSHANALGLNEYIEEREGVIHLKPAPSLNYVTPVIVAGFEAYARMADECFDALNDKPALKALKEIADKAPAILTKLPARSNINPEVSG